MKKDIAITCDEVYGIKNERGDIQIQLLGARLDQIIEDNLEAVKAYLAAQSED